MLLFHLKHYMGKRQTRILRKDILEHSQELLQQPMVQIILRNRVVLYGSLKKITEKQLVLQDQREGKHVLPLPQIEEIIYDKEAAY